MIKVIQVSSDTNIGGAGKCILTFLEHYDRKRFDMAVVLPKRSLLRQLVEQLGVRVIEAEGINETSLGRKGIVSLTKIFKEEKPQIVHTHASMSARVAAKLCGGCKIVFTRHSVFEPSPRISKGLGKVVNGAVNNLLADRIIAVAEAAKKNLTDCGVSEKKIQVILNGIQPVAPMGEQEKEAVRKQYGVAPGQKVISILARLTPVKGHVDLIDAMELILQKGLSPILLIAGTGECEDALRERIRRKKLERFVKLVGFVEDVRGIVNITDISANASFGTEATSMALLEGMCLGKPAVVSDFGGNPGVIFPGRNGLLFPVRDVRTMADCLVRLLTDQAAYETMSQGAREIFREKFTARRYTDEIQQVYLDVIQGGNL